MKRMYLLSIVFLTVSLMGLGQQKYEYVIIEYNSYTTKVSVSLNGQSFSSEKLTLGDQEKSPYNANPLLLKVAEFEDKGWETINFNSVSLMSNSLTEIHFAYLRKARTK
jgi:hypothetical protein